MTALARQLARQRSSAGSVRSDAKKAAAKVRAAKLWEDRRAGRAPLPLFKKYQEEPCLDAFQVGATADNKAVWERGGKLFLVQWNDDDSFQLFAVPEDQIARRHPRPIPFAELAETQENGGTL